MKILIATDGSDYSKAAIEECCRIVIRPENADVMVVSAYEDAYPIMAEPFAISAEYYQKLDDAVSEMAKTFVEEGKNTIHSKFPNAEFPVTTKVLRRRPDQQIIKMAKEWKTA